MKKTLAYFLYTMLIACIVCACSDRMDIIQNYGFDLQTLPVPETVVQNETVEIRCQLIREGYYSEAKYFIRYFQTDGRGELRLDDGTLLTPNDLFPLANDIFRLYYTSRSNSQQNVDIYIVDNSGQVVQKSFSFTNDSSNTWE